MNQNQIIDAMKANREFASQKYQVAGIEHDPAFSTLVVDYRGDILVVKIDELYKANMNKALALINLWAKQHGARWMYDSSVTYLFRVI
jgi:hypothetical protein